MPANFRGGADPIVAYFVTGIADISEVEVGPSPKAICLSLKRLVHEAASDSGGRAVQPAYQQDSVRRMKRSGIRCSRDRITQRPAQRIILFDQWKHGELPIHRGAVALHFGAR